MIMNMHIKVPGYNVVDLKIFLLIIKINYNCCLVTLTLDLTMVSIIKVVATWIFIVIFSYTETTQALNNGLALTPPMDRTLRL